MAAMRPVNLCSASLGYEVKNELGRRSRYDHLGLAFQVPQTVALFREFKWLNGGMCGKQYPVGLGTRPQCQVMIEVAKDANQS